MHLSVTQPQISSIFDEDEDKWPLIDLLALPQAITIKILKVIRDVSNLQIQTSLLQDTVYAARTSNLLLAKPKELYRLKSTCNITRYDD